MELCCTVVWLEAEMSAVETEVEAVAEVASAIERQIATVAKEAENMKKWFELEPTRDGAAQRSPPGGPTYLRVQ